MQENKLKNILTEIYALDPGLKEHESVLVQLIERMEATKPDTKLDSAFVAALRAEIISAAAEHSENKRLFNFNFMNKNIYLAAGSLAVASLLFLAFINFYGPVNKPSAISGLLNKSAQTEQGITKLAAGAFGSLTGINAGGDLVAGNQEAAPARAYGLGGGGAGASNAAAKTTTFAAVSLSEADGKMITEPTIEPGVGGDMKIMPLFFGFKYVYTGEDFDLSETEAAVYRRLKGQGNVSRDLARTLSTFGFSDLSLNTFRDLKVTNISFAEDSDLGLLVNFDLNEDNIYIFENWEKWRWKERDACGSDMACWESFRLKIGDVPADSEMIRMSNEFLAKHRVNLDNYGQPQIDNNWRTYYDQAPDKANFYIPENITVVYPLLINGEEVRDQSGGYAGLRVTINIVRKAASGLSGLAPYRYEASDYVMETDRGAIIKVAENGGWNRNYYMYMQSENLQTIELGTPTKSYVQTWKHDNGRNDELLVPALIFPVLNRPTSEFYYYGGDYVVVPLVKEMIEELGRKPEVWPMWIDGVEPIMPVIDGGNTSSGAGASGSVGPVGGLEPAIKPEVTIMPIEPMLLEQ